MTRWVQWLLVFFIVTILAAILMPVSSGSPHSPATICINKLKQLTMGALLYENDFDKMPDRDSWMDGIEPNVKSPPTFICPEAPKGTYGYAFNGALSWKKMDEVPDQDKIPLLYDSINYARNASDLFTSLPVPGRHRKGETNNVAYADGHVHFKALAKPISPTP